MKNNNTIQWRITQLEKAVDSLDGKIDDVLQNHLPHLQGSIIEVRDQVKINSLKIGIIVGAISAVASIIGNELIRKMFG